MDKDLDCPHCGKKCKFKFSHVSTYKKRNLGAYYIEDIYECVKCGYQKAIQTKKGL